MMDVADKSPYDVYKEKLNELGRIKRMLINKCALFGGEQYADEWLDLSRKYQEIDAHSNYHACMVEYRRLKGLPKLPEDQFPWQEHTDI